MLRANYELFPPLVKTMRSKFDVNNFPPLSKLLPSSLQISRYFEARSSSKAISGSITCVAKEIT